MTLGRTGRRQAPKRARLQVGAIAQLVERVLCKHEVVGSIPSGSTNPRDQDQDFAGPLIEGGRIDIVNEGSSRTLPSVGQVGPEEDIKNV